MNKKLIIVLVILIIICCICFINKNKVKNEINDNNTSQTEIIKYDENRKLYYIQDSETGYIISASENKEELNIYLEQPELYKNILPENFKSLDEWENLLKESNE